MAKRPDNKDYTGLNQIQAEDFSDGEEYDSTGDEPSCVAQYEPLITSRNGGALADASAHSKGSSSRKASKKQGRRNSGTDLKSVKAGLQDIGRVVDSTAHEAVDGLKRVGNKIFNHKPRVKSMLSGPPEIYHSVFQAPEGIRPATEEDLLDDDGMTKELFDRIVGSVRSAIEQGVDVQRNSKGSSGSYYALNSSGKRVGIFKPKDEEPYAIGNPKWGKWVQRTFFPCMFGRGCLVVNLSYVSEAAAYTLDRRLGTNIVPYTDIVMLKSNMFHYTRWDRLKCAWENKPLQGKIGSFQRYMDGYRDASDFFDENPWPGQHNEREEETGCFGSVKKIMPGYTKPERGEEGSMSQESPHSRGRSSHDFVWTKELQQSLREGLEKLVILDYIMRNTDRGADNWMIRVNWGEAKGVLPESEVTGNTSATEFAQTSKNPYKSAQPMQAAADRPRNKVPVSIDVAAIDNSLAWPWKHPDQWRSFPYAWLGLPDSLINGPFSQKTRSHFLPLLCSKTWWTKTRLELRKVFSQDADFKEKMFAKQMAVMKGQAWNVVESLKDEKHGPVQLSRRDRVCVWDEMMNVPIAIPMRASVDLRHSVHEDLTNDTVTGPSPSDNMGLSSPTAGSMPKPNPSRPELTLRHSEDAYAGTTRTTSPESVRQSSENLPLIPGASARRSYDGPSRGRSQINGGFEDRRLSSSLSRDQRSTEQLLSGMDSIQEDRNNAKGKKWAGLQAAEAEESAGHQREVIVERLEKINGKPWFERF